MAQRKRAVGVLLTGSISSKLTGAFGKASGLLGRYHTALGGVDAAHRRTKSSAQGLTAGLRGGVGSLFKVAAGAAAAYVSMNQLVALGRSSLQEYQGQIRANERLAQLMGNVRGTTLAQIEAVKSYASELQKVTTIGDDVSISGASQLATFRLQAKSIQALMPAMTDLMAGTYGVKVNQDNAIQSANLLGKVFTGQVGALRRVGISFTKAQEQVMKMGTEEQKVATLVKVLDQNYGGLAKRLARTPEGKIVQLANAWGDVREELGGRLQPIQMAVIDYLSSHLPQIQALIFRLFRGITSLATQLKPAATALIGMLSGVYTALAPTARNLFPALVSVIRVAGGAVAILAKNWSWLGPLVIGLVGGYMTYIKVTQALLLAKKALLAIELALKVAQMGTPWGLVAAAIGLVIGAVYLLVKNWDKVKATAVGAATTVWGWIRKNHEVLLLLLGPIGLVARAFAANWDKIKAGAVAVWGWVKKLWDLLVKMAKASPVALAAKAVGGRITEHAEGGIVSRPTISWLGERGPEAVIPLTGNRNRALGLLQTAGAAIGGRAGLHESASFAITINAPSGDAQGIQSVVPELVRRISRELEGLAHDRDRRSFR